MSIIGICFLITVICGTISIVQNSQQKKKKKAMISFLSENEDWYCDDCIADMCEISKRDDVINICNKNKKNFEKSLDNNCARCRNVKLTRKLIKNSAN